MFEPPSLRLPAGMRDFAPAAASVRRRIAETVLRVFERWGYSRVITPAFEYEDVLALGLGRAGRDAAIRFVEPSSGRVVALRPDITPQIARLVATRFRDEVGPLRLCYEGTVVRFDRGTRSHRELIQAGVELCGVGSPSGDAEVIALGADALIATGLPNPTIDVGHLGLARELLDALALPEDALVPARERLAKRDRVGLADVLRRAKGGKKIVAFALSLTELAGPPSILRMAMRRAPTPAIRRAILELEGVVKELAAREVGVRLHVDLAEVRGFDYYTGVRIQGYVDGAPEAVLQGGRYDSLLGRYGRPAPAVGFAIDVEATAGAVEAHGVPMVPNGEEAGSRFGAVLVTGRGSAAVRLAEKFRAGGRSAAVDYGALSGKTADAYAERWNFSEVIRSGARTRPAHKKGARK